MAAAEAAGLFVPMAEESRLLVAVSGGPDSVALLGLLAEWAAISGRPALFAATVDHGLRPEAAAEAEAVGHLCARLGVEHAVLRWLDPKRAAGVQAQARAARYRLLVGHARALGGAAIVTAHTLDDQAETVLMRLAHGSGPAGLAAMRPRVRMGDTPLYRPLLSVPKARLVATAQARGLPFVTDPSNADARFERVRWRGILPMLAGTGIDAPRLATLAERCARLDAAVEARVNELSRALIVRVGEAVSIVFDRLVADQPEEIVLRLLARAVATEGGETARLERLEACARALSQAALARRRLRRTLAGRLLTLEADGTLTVAAEGPRRRGVHPASA